MGVVLKLELNLQRDWCLEEAHPLAFGLELLFSPVVECQGERAAA